jgi:hypothetical protein
MQPIRAEGMGKAPKPFVFQLTQAEVAELTDPVGEGGHQSLHRRLLSELAKGNTVTFDDAELGELIRYMTQYGTGGFQGRLYRAFIRSLTEQLRL